MIDLQKEAETKYPYTTRSIQHKIEIDNLRKAYVKGRTDQIEFYLNSHENEQKHSLISHLKSNYEHLLSKSLQAEKLKAQIEALEWMFNYSTNDSKITSKLEEKIEELTQQLTQLQNE